MELTPSQRHWLTLALVPGVGSTLFIRLLARFGRPEEALRASCAALAEVVGPAVADRIHAYRDYVDVDLQERLLHLHEAQLITMDDPAYPTALAEIYDPPLALFVRGSLQETDQYALAIVGTRHPTDYGTTQAERLARDLAARGITVVSGLAEGIDAAAHRGAMAAGGRTIAVLGCGVDEVFPAHHGDLMQEIIHQGAVISPFPMGMKALKGNFPRRNRIISGISLGVLVIEAPPDSGSLITARHAAEQGREVFALPGPVGRRVSMGPHALIREGAKLVETAEDMLLELNLPATAYIPPEAEEEKEEALPPSAPLLPGLEKAPPSPVKPSPAEKPAIKHNSTAPAAPKAAAALTTTESDILASLNPEGSFVDEVSLVCRISISEALSALTMLELKGLVRQLSGKRFAPK